MGVPLGVFPGCLSFHLTFPHAVGIAFQERDVGVMREAIEQGGDAGGVGEDGIPFLKAFVGPHDDGIAFIARNARKWTASDKVYNFVWAKTAGGGSDWTTGAAA
jgi:hypothetical protein